MPDEQCRKFSPLPLLQIHWRLLCSNCSHCNGGDAEEHLLAMWNMFVFAILSGMVGLIAYEIIQEIGGSSEALHDHYHE